MANPTCRERGFCIFYFLLPTIEETNRSHQFWSKFCWKFHLPLKPPFTAMRVWKTCWILWISCGMALGNYGFLFGKPPNVQKLKGNLSWRSNEFLLVHVWRFGHRVMLCLNLMLCGRQLKLFYLLVLHKHFLFVGSSTCQSFIQKHASSPWKLIWFFRKWCVFLCVFVSKTSVRRSRTCTKLCKSQQISLPILEPSHPPLSLKSLRVCGCSVQWFGWSTLAARNDLQELQISEKWWGKSPQIIHGLIGFSIINKPSILGVFPLFLETPNLV